MITITDQTGNSLYFSKPPEKLVCLVPSLTETIADAGLENHLAGITKFCVHPMSLRDKVRIIGGTKNPRVKDIFALKPDLIIANKEENRHEDIEAFRQFTQVYVSDIKTSHDVSLFLSFLQTLYKTDGCHHLIEQIENLHNLPVRLKIPTCYLIWKDPLMTIGNDTFIHHMMEKYGFSNVFGNKLRYPQISYSKIEEYNPEIIMLSTEPYPFKETDISNLSHMFPASKVVLVDGEMFSWYGSRIIKANGYLNQLYSSHLYKK